MTLNFITTHSFVHPPHSSRTTRLLLPLLPPAEYKRQRQRYTSESKSVLSMGVGGGGSRSVTSSPDGTPPGAAVPYPREEAAATPSLSVVTTTPAKQQPFGAATTDTARRILQTLDNMGKVRHLHHLPIPPVSGITPLRCGPCTLLPISTDCPFAFSRKPLFDPMLSESQFPTGSSTPPRQQQMNAASQGKSCSVHLLLSWRAPGGGGRQLGISPPWRTC